MPGKDMQWTGGARETYDDHILTVNDVARLITSCGDNKWARQAMAAREAGAKT